MPFFSCNTLSRKTIDPFIKGFHTDTLRLEEHDPCKHIREQLQYKEYLPTQVYFAVKDGLVAYEHKLTEEQERLRELKQDYDFTEADKPSHQYVAFELENVGNGCAVSLCIRLKKDGGAPSESMPISVVKGAKLYVGIFFDAQEENKGSYLLSLFFSDIYKNQYSQEKQVLLVAGDKGCEVDFAHEMSAVKSRNVKPHKC